MAGFSRCARKCYIGGMCTPCKQRRAMLAKAATHVKAGEVKKAATTAAQTVAHFVKHPPAVSGGLQMGKIK